ncbi:MAG: hypothetical protein ACJ8R9_14685 [Steroidobacteraceae bacterium]
MLEEIPNYPQTFMDRHMNWHMGGRTIPQGQVGSGAEFLDFHHQFVADVKSWYAGVPGSIPSKLDAWLHFPADLVAAHPALTDFENNASDGSLFSTEDSLGIFVEATHNSVHGWIAALYGQPEFGDLDSCKYFMFYQWHGMIDTWRGHWLTSHKSAIKDVVDNPKFTIKDVVDVNPKILRDVVTKQFEFPPKNPKELVEVPGRVDPGDPLVQISQRVAQLENLVHQGRLQAFIRKDQRPKVG